MGAARRGRAAAAGHAAGELWQAGVGVSVAGLPSWGGAGLPSWGGIVISSHQVLTQYDSVLLVLTTVPSSCLVHCTAIIV